MNFKWCNTHVRTEYGVELNVRVVQHLIFMYFLLDFQTRKSKTENIRELIRVLSVSFILDAVETT